MIKAELWGHLQCRRANITDIEWQFFFFVAFSEDAGAQLENSSSIKRWRSQDASAGRWASTFVESASECGAKL